MIQNFTVFYSWQSDLKSKTNKNLISSSLETAIKELNKGENIKLEINFDRDTRNRNGSPNIADVIFEKIKNCNLFICDVTIINNTFYNKICNNRLTPNPNVLIELGYAIKLLGWERIICINNLKYCANEQLPFDLRGHRITNYNSSTDNSKYSLKEIFKKAISSTISNYEEINKRHLENSFITHDKAIFQKTQEICDESELNYSLSLATNSLFITQYYYDKWDNLADFYRVTLNNFLDKDLDKAYREFIKELNSFEILCCQNFHLVREASPSIFELEEQGVVITDELQIEISKKEKYSVNKNPFQDENWGDADKRLYKLQIELNTAADSVKLAYKELVLLIKKKSLV